MLAAIIVASLLVALLAAVILGFNALVRRRNRCDNAWAQVDVQLTKRHDLIPNLVETVKGYAAHERQAFESVTAARAAAVDSRGPASQASAEAQLTSAVDRLLLVAEAYPGLQANDSFLSLQTELVSVESGIAYTRQYYNDAVLSYESARLTFPGIVIATVLGFHRREYFKAAGDAATPTQVSLH